jgi:hypothetical protein
VEIVEEDGRAPPREPAPGRAHHERAAEGMRKAGVPEEATSSLGLAAVGEEDTRPVVIGIDLRQGKISRMPSS